MTSPEFTTTITLHDGSELCFGSLYGFNVDHHTGELTVVNRSNGHEIMQAPESVWKSISVCQRNYSN